MKNGSVKYIILLFIIVCKLNSYAQSSNLTVENAVSYALENNYGIVLGTFETEKAKINNSWANAGLYPNINFTGNSINQIDFIENNGYAGQLVGDLGLNWSLFNHFKLFITKDKLLELHNLAKGNSAVLVENTVEDVILIYYLTLLEQEKLNVFASVLDLSLDRFKYEEKREELGASLSYEVLQAKNNYLTDKANYLNQKVRLREINRSLNFLMGIDSVSSWNYTSEFDTDTTSFQKDSLLKKMFALNNVLKNQYINLKIKQQDILLKKRDYLPEINISSGIRNIYNTSSGNTNNGNINYFYGNASVTYNIFNGGNKKRAVEIAHIDEDVAQTGIEEMKHILKNELLNALDYYNARKELLAIALENQQTAKLNLDIANQKYKTGTINSFDYREIQIIYLNASIQQLNAIYNVVQSHTELVRLTGGFIF